MNPVLTDAKLLDLVKGTPQSPWMTGSVSIRISDMGNLWLSSTDEKFCINSFKKSPLTNLQTSTQTAAKLLQNRSVAITG